MRQHTIRRGLEFLFLAIILGWFVANGRAVPPMTHIFTDPTGDVYRGTTVGYLGSSWDKVTDPAVDLTTISLTGNEIEVIVTGGLLAENENYLVYCIYTNSSGGNYQMTMFVFQSGTWSCSVVSSSGSGETPALTVTNTELIATTANIAFSFDEVTAYAVRYVLFSPAVLNVDFYPDSTFVQGGGNGSENTFLGLESWVWWVIVIASSIIVLVMLVMRKAGSRGQQRLPRARRDPRALHSREKHGRGSK